MRVTEAEISVVIPVKNGFDFLERAFNSIRSISKKVEIVLVENGSSDKTLELCHSLADSNTQVIHLDTSGVSNARNVGIAAANRNVITLLDADDEMLRDRMDYIITREWHENDLVIGTMQYLAVEESKFPPEIKRAISSGLPMYAANALTFTKKGFDNIGGFDTKLSHGEDLDLILKAKHRGLNAIYTERPFLIRHFHTQNATLDRPELISGMFSALRANIKNSESKTTNLRILHVMPKYVPHKGGIETLMSQYFDLTAENQSLSHSIITLRHEHDLSAELTRGVSTIDEIIITRAGIQESILHTTLLVIKQLREIIVKRDPHLIHLHAMHELSTFTLKVAQDLGISVIFHFHGNLISNNFKILKPAVPLMKYVLGVSEATRISLAKFLPPEVLIHTITNGVKDQTVIPNLDQKSKDPTILIAGRVEPEKGFDIAIQSFVLIKAAFPEAKLIVLGNGTQFKDLVTLAKELGVSESVHFAGAVTNEEVIKQLDKSWIALVPSREIEGFGIIAVEAALRKVPVIASAVGGLIETVEDGKSGYLVPPESPLAIAEKAIEILTDIDELERIGVYARARALKLFGIVEFAEELDEYYFEIYERELKP
jgi:glycosyltransferase involved in cell wall biosynthesis/GT2 family glycosyltransferase